MAKKAKSKKADALPKSIAGVKVPKAVRKSSALGTLFNSELGREILADALLAAAGAAAAALYARAQPVRSFLSVLIPAPLVFLILFLFISPVRKLTLEGEASAKSIGGGARAPVVILGLDELPTTSLLGPDGRVDRERYPGFAQLGRIPPGSGTPTASMTRRAGPGRRSWTATTPPRNRYRPPRIIPTASSRSSARAM
jgi:hypothetical protein